MGSANFKLPPDQASPTFAHISRSGPGTNYHKLGTFNPCTAVHVVAYNHGWAKVYFNHNYYWVSAKYLQNQSCHWAPKKKHHKKHYNQKHHNKHYNNY